MRDRRFNPRRAAQASGVAEEREALAESYSPALAAMLIFLNRTGFNGLFRLNRQGAFNVPAGRYTDPTHLRRRPPARGGGGVSRPGRGDRAGARSTRRWATPGRGDFVYCDPPYAPLSRTASFASYTADGFSLTDQARLCDAVIAASRRGASRGGVQFQRAADPEPLFQSAGARGRPARAAGAGAPVDQLAGGRHADR